MRLLPSAAALLAMVGLAWAGHEVAVYPSYYPHEIRIEVMTPKQAAPLLGEAKLHAYLGPEPDFSGRVPSSVRVVQSLGGWVVVRLNPQRWRADERQGCDVVETILRDVAGREGFVFHPYPVTPWHGDYLYHLDRAEAEKARLLSEPATSPPRKLRISAKAGAAPLVRPEWRATGTDWDAAIEQIEIADLLAAARSSLDGWLGPPWLKAGWFHAVRLLGEVGDQRAQTMEHRLEDGNYQNPVERTNLERDLVAALNGSCDKRVAGYWLKRQYFSAEFTNGIENIGFDSMDGLNSPTFIRTVKLKDFPWNGWLNLAIDTSPAAAWNPIAGFGDAFGRLLWSAIGDPALIPAPYDSGSMLNRVADVQADPAR